MRTDILRSRCVIVVITFVVVLSCLLEQTQAATARRGKVTKHHRHEYFRDHVLDLLPDTTDHGIMRQMRCSACNELSAQLYETLLNLYRSKDPTHSELIDVIDNMCLHHVNMYGLLPDPANVDKASTTFSRDASLERVQGLWINKFMKERCSHLMVNHEEAIIEKHPEADSLAHFQTMMCIDWDNSCDRPSQGNNDLKAATNLKAKVIKPLSRGTFSRSMRPDEM